MSKLGMTLVVLIVTTFLVGVLNTSGSGSPGGIFNLVVVFAMAGSIYAIWKKEPSNESPNNTKELKPIKTETNDEISAKEAQIDINDDPKSESIKNLLTSKEEKFETQDEARIKYGIDSSYSQKDFDKSVKEVTKQIMLDKIIIEMSSMIYRKPEILKKEVFKIIDETAEEYKVIYVKAALELGFAFKPVLDIISKLSNSMKAEYGGIVDEYIDDEEDQEDVF